MSAPSSAVPSIGDERASGASLFDAMDLTRILAAIAVLCSHGRMFFGWESPWWGFLGPPAVALFFVVSGFCVWGSIRRKQVFHTGNFLLDRMRRIYPAYLLSMLAMWICVSLLEGRLNPVAAGHILGNLFMFQDVGAVRYGSYHEPFLGNVVLWSLAYEWWTYLLVVPLMKFVPDRFRFVAVLGLVLVCGWIYHRTGIPFLSYGTFLGLWWMGAELGQAAEGVRGARGRIAFIAISTGCFWFLETPQELLQYLPTALHYHPLLLAHQTLLAGLFCIGMLVWQRMGFLGLEWGASHARSGARISYGLYLFQIPVCLVLASMMDGVNSWLRFFAGLLCTALVAHFADHRLDLWMRKFTRKPGDQQRS